MRTAWLVALAFGCGKSAPATQATSEAGAEAGISDAMTDAPADAPPFIACTPVSGSTISLRKIGTVVGTATLAASPPNDGRLFVVEEPGAIRIFDHEQLLPKPFLDLSEQDPTCVTLTDDASCAARPDCVAVHTTQGTFANCNVQIADVNGEQGLLGLAFHPSYATNRQFFIFYTDACGG